MACSGGRDYGPAVQAERARTVRRTDGTYVITASPNAAVVAKRWSGELKRTCLLGATLVVLDLGETTTVDGRGLRLLVAVGDDLHAAGGMLCVVVTSPQVLHVLDVSGADQHFAVRPTVVDGLAALAASA
jgi:anti-anti-sigma regulatory factor